MTIMQRPDKIPAGPTDGRFFAVCAIGGFDIQAYPKFKHLVIRFLLIKVNRWYGSAFEIQCGIKDGSINRPDPEEEIKNAGPSVPKSGKSGFKPKIVPDLKPKPQS